MRGYVIYLLIVCGTLLALAPIASDFVQARQIAELAAQEPDFTGPAYFRQPLDETYCLASWVLGIAMISLGIIRSWRPAAAVGANCAVGAPS